MQSREQTHANDVLVQVKRMKWAWVGYVMWCTEQNHVHDILRGNQEEEWTRAGYVMWKREQANRLLLIIMVMVYGI